MKLKKLVAGLSLAALALVGVSAQAQTLRLQDDDVDFLLNPDLTPKTQGTFAVGDILVSVFEIPTATLGGANILAPDQELTGVAAVQIESITGTGGVGTVITFSEVSLGLNAIIPVDVAGGGAGDGATIAMFLNSTADFDLQLDFAQNPATNCFTMAQCVAEATAGTLFQVDGFFGDADEFWEAVLTRAGGADPSVVVGLGGSTGVAQFNAAQTTTFNATGPVAFQNINNNAICPAGSLAADDCVQGPTITGPLTGGAGLNPSLIADGAFARSDFDAQKQLAVPEPGVLALLGMGFVGLALTRRRRT